MTILAPQRLLLLLALVPIGLIQLRAYFAGRADLDRLGRHLDQTTAQTVYLVKWFFGALSFNAFVALAVIALADPTWGERPVEEDRENLDVVVALDISRSMLAEDTEPNRLLRSLAVVRSTSRQLPSARFALLAFKGDASTLLPLTEDLNALETVLDGITPDLISTPGTDLERGLAAALEAFPIGSNAHRAVILISDGESLSGTPERAARSAQSDGIPVITIVAGTPDGATLISADGTVLTDEDGRPVVSRADREALEAIALTTEGLAEELNEPDIVPRVVRFLSSYVRERDSSGFRLVPVQRYPMFLGIALAMLGLSMAIRIIRWQEMF